MRLWSYFAACALALGVATSANAVPLPFNGTFSLQIGGLPTITSTGSGTGNFSGPGGAASIPAGVFSIATTAAINPPLLVIDGFGAGAPGQIGTGSLPFSPGSNKALAFGGVTGNMGLDLAGYLITGLAGATPNAAAEINLGIIGLCCVVQKFVAIGGLVMGTVKVNPYQLGMVTVMGALQGVPSTVMGSGFDNRTGGGGGVLQLVSPTVVALGALGSLASVATLRIDIVPEPATALLVVFGLAALAGLRARSR